MDFVYTTFCFGERYQNQTNRLINSLESIGNKNLLFVVTDKPDKIKKLPWVNIKNISEYNKKYINYAKNYFDFDFSVKRYTLRFALENNFTKIILIDTDNIVGNRFSNENINKSFEENSILGPVIYEYEKEVVSNARLGLRFNHYEKIFNTQLNKKSLWMPEDCIQYINIEKGLFNGFLDTWDQCIEIKYKDKLPNVPAGNIDEMCFSALKNNIKVGGNSDNSVNIFTPQHDIWYR
jgi:hypothetical protein